MALLLKKLLGASGDPGVQHEQVAFQNFQGFRADYNGRHLDRFIGEELNGIEPAKSRRILVLLAYGFATNVDLNVTAGLGQVRGAGIPSLKRLQRMEKGHSEGA